MKIVNLPRFIVAITIITCVLSFIVSMITVKVFSASPEVYDNVIVSKGDTIWSIASQIKGDINKNVYEIKKINNLKNSIIYVGQELQVPAQIWREDLF